MYDESLASVNKYLPETTETGLWYGQADMNTGNKISSTYGALDAFFPAVLSLGGDLNSAIKLQNSCYYMWTRFDIEPEQFDYKTGKVIYPNYVLRPEIIESAYYLYHYTKDQKYIEMGKTFFDSIVKYCKVDEGYAALKSVVTKEKNDSMESFFFAETLKYFYLLFSTDGTNALDKYIFNTEAHPIKRIYSNEK